MADVFLVTNRYHGEIVGTYFDTDFNDLVKETLDSLKDHSKDFDNEIEDDWAEYYDSYKEAQEANADSILETFIDETTIWRIPEDEYHSDVTYIDLVTFDKYKEEHTELSYIV